MTNQTRAEKAERCIRSAQGKSIDRAAVIIAEAQAEAQLAVAEQLRIGNLIALAGLAGKPLQESDYDEGATLSSAGMHGLIEYRQIQYATPYQGEDEAPFIRPEIARALGVEQ